MGGKLLGAGGGFLVFYVLPEKQRAVREAMKNLLYIPFKFENSVSCVILYDPESYASKALEEFSKEYDEKKKSDK